MGATPDRIAAVVAVLATALSLSGCTPDPPSPKAAVNDPATRVDLRSFYTQKPHWKPCGEEECATLKVPMDYADPGDGRTFTLPLIRVTAADPERRIGSLVFDPGGPGESGVAFLQDGGVVAFSDRLQDRFDIVGFDPRGVAGSVPALECGADEEETSEGDVEPEPLYPATAEQRRVALADAESTLAACEEHSGAILPHVGTADAARDMDVLRAALGEDRLSYLGWSYGTALGTAYGELFAHRVRAMVLDGAVDPSLDWSEAARSQAEGFHAAVDDYAENCAEVAGDLCPADSPDGIRELLKRLYEETAKEPLPVDDSEGDLDTYLLHTAVTMSMYWPEDQWEALSRGLSDAADGDGTKLAGIASEEAGEEDSSDNSDAALIAVNCVDIPHPKSPQEYWKALDQALRTDGDFGAESVVAALDCKGWPQRGPGPHRVKADGLPPVLVVGTTGDPATPYHEAQSLAHQLPQGMLLTFDGLGHTAYGRGGSCVDDAVDGYLIDLEPVKPGTTC
ncbi:hypothetical protein AQJ91_27065 [Streptomyces dysideae]|uniref:AB hydrolase-1 domain-containing protein n=1 Tax=Streptomyces dysideae TaxID=909626 RepID=A0A117RZD3_9ACTN|nr:hypothetical protein AQJ91_27065 [Streptomyces dysideae]